MPSCPSCHDPVDTEGCCSACMDADMLAFLLDHGVDMDWLVKHNFLSRFQSRLVNYNYLQLSLFSQ